MVLSDDCHELIIELETQVRCRCGSGLNTSTSPFATPLLGGVISATTKVNFRGSTRISERRETEWEKNEKKVFPFKRLDFLSQVPQEKCDFFGKIHDGKNVCWEPRILPANWRSNSCHSPC